MIIPDRTGVMLGYRVWRVIPGKWVPPSESLYAQTCHRSWSLMGPTSAYCPPPVRGGIHARVGAGDTPRGAVLLQGREGPARGFCSAARCRRGVPRALEREALAGRGPAGSRGGGGCGGATRIFGRGGEKVVKVKAGGEEKPEREEVVEPLEEPTPERRKEERREGNPLPEKEPEKLPA